jgi:hypothetical protein
MQNNSKHFFNSPPSDWNSQKWLRLIHEIFNRFLTQFAREVYLFILYYEKHELLSLVHEKNRDIETSY